MSEEPPIDLRALDTADVHLVHEAARRFRRRMLVRALWVLVFALAIGSATLNFQYRFRGDLASQVAGSQGTVTDGDYRVKGAQIGLLKVAPLSGNRWGLQLVVHWDSPATAGATAQGVFTLTSGPNSTATSSLLGLPVVSPWAQTIVVVPVSVGRRFDLSFIGLTDINNQVLGTFTVDLDALGVPPAGGH